MYRSLAAVLIGLLLVGCASRPRLSGSSWKTEVLGGDSTFTFGDDGSAKMDIRLPLIGTLPATGTFSETNKSVSLTLHKVELPKNPFQSDADRLVNQVVGRPILFNLTWKSADEVELAPSTPAGPFGQKMLLKRQGK